MSNKSILTESTDLEILDLNVQFNNETTDRVTADYGRCIVQGCGCSSFEPILIPGGAATCSKCGHGINQHR